MKYLLIFMTIMVTGFACNKESNEAIRVEVIAGITYIHNTEKPLHINKIVRFEEELSINEEDEQKKVILFKPLYYLVDKSEQIYICDAQEQTIKVFDKQGKLVRTIGAKGNGPGEFKYIISMALLPDDGLLVMDLENRRTSIFKNSGDFIQSFQWRGSHSNIFLTTNSSCIINEKTYGKNLQLFVKKYNFSGKEMVSFGEFTPIARKTLVNGESSFSISLPYAPESVFTGDQTRLWLYHCLNDRYTIEVYDQDGRLFRKIDRPYNPVPSNSEDAKLYYASVEQNPNKIFVKLAKEIEFPKVKTITERLLVDDAGNLWVETNEAKKQHNCILRAYDIFNKNGFYEAKIWIDIRPGLFVKGKMYNMVTDEETGFRKLKRYRVIWND